MGTRENSGPGIHPNGPGRGPTPATEVGHRPGVGPQTSGSAGSSSNQGSGGHCPCAPRGRLAPVLGRPPTSPGKVKLVASGRRGQRGHRAGVLSSNSLGSRGIFISRRWAPGAPGAQHAATARKPSHPRDKDRCMTDPAVWPGGERPARWPARPGDPPAASGMLATDGDHRPHRQKGRGGEKKKKRDRSLPLGVCSGSSRTLASLCR